MSAPAASLWLAVAAQPRPVASSDSRAHEAIRAARKAARRRLSQRARFGGSAAYGGPGWGYHRDSNGVIAAGVARFPLWAGAAK